ncbi:MAG: hypothetical protein KJ971_08670 [Firmicutes bacterium]|nr:hypothetical protein [Bacillota bacterium]
MPEKKPLSISDLIDRLQKFKAEHGDLPVYGACDGGFEFILNIEGDVLLKEPRTENSQHPELYPPTLYPKRVVIGDS